jgi:hypothetical protein
MSDVESTVRRGAVYGVRGGCAERQPKPRREEHGQGFQVPDSVPSLAGTESARMLTRIEERTRTGISGPVSGFFPHGGELI